MEKFENSIVESKKNQDEDALTEKESMMKAKLRQLFAFFKSKDAEIESVEKSATNLEPEDIKEIKEEIHLEEQLSRLNTEAERLEKEAVSLERESGSESYFDKVLSPYLNVVSNEDEKPKLLAELRDEAKKRIGKANGVKNEELMADAMKQALIERCRKTVSLEEKAKKSKGKWPNAQEFFAAKVVTLAAGDPFPLEKYQALGYKEPYRALFHGYLDLSDSPYSMRNSGLKLNKAAVGLLISAGYQDYFLEMGGDERKAGISEYHDQLIIALIEKAKSQDFSEWKRSNLHDELGHIAENQKCSREVYEKMISCGATHQVIKHLENFQDVISPSDISDFSRRYSCAYPYMLDNLFAGIEKTDWTEEEKLEAKRNAMKFQSITGSNYRYYFGQESMKEFKDIADHIRDLDQAEDLDALRGEIETGRLPYFHECRRGFKKLLDEDPEFVISQAKRFDQEHLLFHKLTGSNLNKLKNDYIEKLAGQGDFDMIVEFEKKGELANILDKEIYLLLAEKGHLASLNSVDSIDDRIYSIYKDSGLYRDKSIFDNIDKVNLQDPTFRSVMEYKKMVNYVRDFFSNDTNVPFYEEMNLRPQQMKETSWTDFKETFEGRIGQLAEYLKKDPKNTEERVQIADFVKRLGVDVLAYNPSELQNMLDDASALPQFISSGNTERFRKTLDFLNRIDPESKKEFINELTIVTDFFSVGSPEFINYFLKLKGVDASHSINSSTLFGAAYKLTDDFSSLPDEHKNVLRQVIPGIESVGRLKDNILKSFPDGAERTAEELKNTFRDLVETWRKEDLEKYCGYVEVFGNAPFPGLYSLYLELLNHKPQDLSLAAQKTLKVIGVNLEKEMSKDDLIDSIRSFVKEMMPESVSAGIVNSESYLKRAFSTLRLSALADEKQDPKFDFVAPFYRAECKSSGERDPEKFSAVDYSSLTQKIPENTWATNLWLYINGKEGHFGDAETMTKPFDDVKYRDEVFKDFKKEWLTVLETGNNRLNLKLDTLCSTVDYYGGAGNLKHVESLSNLMVSMRDHAWSNPKTTLRTKREIAALLLEQEKRFEKEKWTQDACSEFYSLSADIIEAAPSLYSSFKPVFDRLNGKEMKQFARELLPLYQAKLVTLQSVDHNGEMKYKPKDLLEMRNALTGLAGLLEVYPEDKQENLSEHKNELLGDLRARFKVRFGINKIPDDMNKDSIRTISNCVRYMGNISDRGKKNEALISLYLSLGLNNEWKDFRAGKAIDLDEYLVKTRVNLISETIEKRARENRLSCELANISPEDEPEFQKLLQAETSSTMMGSIQTIDEKLLSLKSHIQELGDPDAYPDATDKELLEVCRSGPKALNSLLAKIYGETAGKSVTYGETERDSKEKLEKIFSIRQWDGATVKQIQDRAQPMNLIFNILDNMEKEQLDQKVIDLRTSLLPSAEVIKIFNSVEEGFKPESGAYALFRDLEYLEGLVVKADEQLSAEDKKQVEAYLKPIREKMAGLEKLMSRVKENFNKLSDIAEKSNQPLLKDRLKDLKQAFERGQGDSLIQSYLVNDLNLIIENMRQCLGCLRKEANNDTNLSFGDYNKFFLMSRQGKEEGSVADQIIYLVPVKNPKTGEQELSFVLDRIYGEKNSDLLVAHALTVHKKYAALKEKFKEAKLGMVVSQSAMQSVGIYEDDFIKKFKEKLGQDISASFEGELEAEVKASALSDHYVEFASRGVGRIQGEIPLSGVMIKI